MHQQAVEIDRPRQADLAAWHPLETERAVIRLVADQNHRRIAGLGSLVDRNP